MVRQQLFIGAALIAGVAIGFFVQPERDSPSAPAPVEEGSSARPIADKGDAAAMAALRARIRELEAKLARAHKSDEELVSNTVERIEVARRERGPEGPRAWMENMRRDNPEMFAQMTNRFARWRQDRKAQHAERANFFASVDTSRMSAAARKTHEDYRNLLARREAIEERLHNPDLADEERHEVMNEMFSVNREMHRTGAAERRVLLDEVAREVGLEGDAANELVQTVREVYEATESGWGGDHRGGDRRGGGRRRTPPPGR